MAKQHHINVTTALENFKLPYLNMDPVSAKIIKDLKVDAADAVSMTLCLGFPLSLPARTALIEQIRNHLMTVAGISSVQITLEVVIKAHAVQAGLALIPDVKNVIAISSGKGGVGKSTVAVNLALALLQEGARVGLLDADIYGPNQPHMLGASLRPKIEENKRFHPVECHGGLQTMSIGYLVDQSTPMIWRGPMVSSALRQLVDHTLWQDLDYLLIDLPPGTGDIQLTLSQKVPVSGAVVVTTPQDVALLDAQKGLAMFKKVNVPVLGVIENMSGHVCSQCGHEEHTFGYGGGERLADGGQVKFLGRVPLALEIRQALDQGCPTVVAHPDGEIATRFRDIARTMAAELAQQPVNYTSKFPNIVVEPFPDKS